MQQCFVLCVHQAPWGGCRSQLALRFARAALAAGHQIQQVFFYQDGVHHADGMRVVPRDEVDLVQAWQALQQTHNLALVCCIGAAQKRGVCAESSLVEGFELEGLGAWVQAIEQADKVVEF